MVPSNFATSLVAGNMLLVALLRWMHTRSDIRARLVGSMIWVGSSEILLLKNAWKKPDDIDVVLGLHG